MYKKKLALFLSCLLVLSLSACSKQDKIKDDFGKSESTEENSDKQTNVPENTFSGT